MKNELTLPVKQPKYTVEEVISAILNKGSDPTTANEIKSHLKAKSSPGYAEFLRLKAAEDSAPRAD
jgi:regulator of RNase E activity RraB